jgi:PKD repeat protein
MRNRAFLKVVLLGLLTFAFVPGLAGAASQGQDLTGMLASSAAERATAVSGPIINVSPASHDFGRINVGSSSGNFDLTIQNNATDGSTLHISAINNSGTGFSASASSLTIPAGGTAALHTAFAPTSGSGPQTDNVQIMSDATNGTFSVLLVGQANNAPVFDPALASDYTATAFVPFSLTATATDLESDALSWSIASVPPLPVGATFNTATGELDWTAGSADVGNYAVTITVSDGAASTAGNFALHVVSSNNPPVANPGGPYGGVTGVDVAFDGSGSFDPDAGQTATLSYSWNFGDGNLGTGVQPSHHYSAPGTYIVSLTVTDTGSPVLSNTNTTTASIVNFVPLQPVLPSGALPIIKTNGNGYDKFGLECYTRSVLDIDPNTITLTTTYPNAGTVSSVTVTAKQVKVGDINGNIFGDLDFSFRASQIRPLLAHVPNGTVVTLVFTAKALSDGVTMRGTIDLAKQGSASISSAAAPNPFKPETNISYTLRDSGPVSIRIFSVNGQLVRTLREDTATPGAYEVRWNGKDDGGRTAPSGIYFVSIKQGTESSQTRIVMAR